MVIDISCYTPDTSHAAGEVLLILMCFAGIIFLIKGDFVMANRLKNQSSPYLLQHAENPVDWYPWCEEAFERAKAEDKPVFLSVGYSTCHWCHVMAHESFEDAETAEILNGSFISIKVDKEERPDIDAIYMTVCQALTGGGGWPMSVFMTPDKKPFFAGTYFPKSSRYGMPGFVDLLKIIASKWKGQRNELVSSAERIVNALKNAENEGYDGNTGFDLVDEAIGHFRKSFDKKYGGFGVAPKFPTPHNLWFLLKCFEQGMGDDTAEMACFTLHRMSLGGIFDHIGYGFSRYSTDKYFLVPHFEKMLYDNALLIIAFCKAYGITKKKVFLDIAQKTASYILREMTSPEGGFYSAQDADSDGEEGMYYVWTPDEIISVLGESDGEKFNRCFGITEKGNFEGKSVPNLLDKGEHGGDADNLIPKVYEHRKTRTRLHLDDKILTGWNSLMIAAMCRLYRESKNKTYLDAAIKAEKYISENLCTGDTLFVSQRGNTKGCVGFLDDYAMYVWALISLYEADLNISYLDKARVFCQKAVADFFDNQKGGFYMSGKGHEEQILKPKETYDGAIPSGNSVMAYNLVRLGIITGDKEYKDVLEKQIEIMASRAAVFPAGYSMFLIALMEYKTPPETVSVVYENESEIKSLPFAVSADSVIRLVGKPTKEYPLLSGKATFYVCRDFACLPPVNDINRL